MKTDPKLIPAINKLLPLILEKFSRALFDPNCNDAGTLTNYFKLLIAMKYDWKEKPNILNVIPLKFIHLYGNSKQKVHVGSFISYLHAMKELQFTFTNFSPKLIQSLSTGIELQTPRLSPKDLSNLVAL